jgi:hypothetical protein
MDINDYAREYEASTQYFFEKFALVAAADLDKHMPDGWSPRQIAHHMADSEAQSYARLRRLIAEPTGSLLQGYDESLWAENPTLGYTELPIENSIAVYQAVRAASFDILKRMTMEDLERSGVHTESGHYTIMNWLQNYTKHARAHADQMMEAIGK